MSLNKNELNPFNGIHVKNNSDVALVALYLSKITVDDSVKAEQFKNYLLNMLKNGTDKIIVDLEHCDSIDSTFLGILVTSLKKSISKRKDIKLTIEFRRNSALLYLTKIENMFKSFPDLNESFEGFEENKN